MKRWPGVALTLFFVASCASSPHTDTTAQEKVTLTLRAPDAREVRLLASCDHFTPRPAIRDPEGVWRSTGLPNIDFNYFYLVDGKPITPDCRFTANDDFGATNCRHIPRIQQASR